VTAGSAQVSEHRPAVASVQLGTMLFIFTEVMFFAGLISAYMVLRSQAGIWPPPNQPRLPVEVTGVNTVILLASAVCMWRAGTTIRRSQTTLTVQWLAITLVLGSVFLAVQGYEWVRLLGFGLTTRSSLYGALFYTLIGSHAVHVLGALIALAVVLRRTTHHRYTAADHNGLLAMRLFWFFVVGIWPVLYALVYLW
jgi:cytochrome c oxidase subunit 3